MAKELDRQRAFGTCHGDEDVGRHYVQDGVFFDSQGKEWVAPEAVADERETAIATAVAEAKAEASKDLDAKIAAAVAAALAAHALQAPAPAPAKK